MGDKLRKLKDEAATLLQKGRFDKALQAYQEILKEEPGDLTAQLKCGDIYRKIDQNEQAIAAYMKVAQAYAHDGLLLKAIAACKLILEIDNAHTETQRVLADLYAKKTGRVPTAAPGPSAAPADEIPTAADEDVVLEEEKAPSPELPTIPLFSDLPKNAFIQLLEQMHMRSLLPGEAIIREGEIDDAMFIISHGLVKVTKTTDTGSELVLAHLSDGSFFGEMALLAESPRTASVIAEQETLLFVVSRSVLDEVVKSYPSVTHILMRFYRQRLLTNLMATSPLFRPLDAQQRKILVESFKSRELPANELILEEGGKGDGLYLLLAGSVEVSKMTDGKRQVLAHLKEGDVFGEMSLLTNNPVSASVRTIKKSIVLKLPRRTFSEVVSTHPQLLAHISELADERAKTTEAILTGKLRFSTEEGLVLM